MKLFHLIEVRNNYPPLWRAEEIARVAAHPAQRSDRRRAQPCWLACALPKVTSESKAIDTRSFVSHLTSSPTILCRFLLLFDLPLHPQLLRFLASGSYILSSVPPCPRSCTPPPLPEPPLRNPVCAGPATLAALCHLLSRTASTTLLTITICLQPISTAMADRFAI